MGKNKVSECVYCGEDMPNNKLIKIPRYGKVCVTHTEFIEQNKKEREARVISIQNEQRREQERLKYEDEQRQLDEEFEVATKVIIDDQVQVMLKLRKQTGWTLPRINGYLSKSYAASDLGEEDKKFIFKFLVEAYRKSRDKLQAKRSPSKPKAKRAKKRKR